MKDPLENISHDFKKDMKEMTARELAEKIVDLFGDESPVPDYIVPKLESLLNSALEEAKKSEYDDCSRAWDCKIEQARAEGYEAGLKIRCKGCHQDWKEAKQEAVAEARKQWDADLEQSTRTLSELVAGEIRKEAYEHAAMIAEKAADPWDQELWKHIHKAELPSLSLFIAERIRQAAKEIK